MLKALSRKLIKSGRMILRARERTELPKASICRAFALNVRHDAADCLFTHIGLNLHAKTLLLTKVGQAIALVDERCERGVELLEFVKVELTRLAVIHNNEETFSWLEEMRDSLENTFVASMWSSEDIEFLNVCIAVVQPKTITTLTLGMAKAEVSHNRLRLRNITSFGSLQEYFLSKIQAYIQVTALREENETRKNCSWQHSDTTINAAIEIHTIEGVTRCVLLASDVWMPNAVRSVMQSALESPLSTKNACTLAKRTFTFNNDRKGGSIGVIDVLPQELDQPDIDEAADLIRNAGKTLKTSKNVGDIGSSFAKASSGLMGKIIGGAIVIGVLTGVVVVGKMVYERYYEPKVQATTILLKSDEKLQSDSLSSVDNSILQSSDTSSVGLPASATQQHDATDAYYDSPQEIARRRANIERLLNPSPTGRYTVAQFPQKYLTPSIVPKPSIPIQFTAASRINPASVVVQIDSVTANGKRIPVPSLTKLCRLEKATNATAIQGIQQYAFRFDKPVPTGRYMMRLIQSRQGKLDTLQCEWRVANNIFTEKSLKQLLATKLLYGRRASIGKLEILPELKDFIKPKQLGIRMSIGNMMPLDFPLTQTLPLIPAVAKKVRFDFHWIDVESTQKPQSYQFFSFERTPEQVPPEIECESVDALKIGQKDTLAKQAQIARNPRLTFSTSNFQIRISGMKVNYEVPIDAEISDKGRTSKSIKATVNDVEPAGDAEIDYNDSGTNLRIYNGDELEPISENFPWICNATTFGIVTGFFDPNTETFPIVIQAKDLPKPSKESRILRGTVAIKVGARIVNRKAGATATSVSPPCIIPINIPY